MALSIMWPSTADSGKERDTDLHVPLHPSRWGEPALGPHSLMTPLLQSGQPPFPRPGAHIQEVKYLEAAFAEV